MQLDLNTLIGLGILSVLGYGIRLIFALREDVRSIKTTLGVNGNPELGVISEVAKLRDAKHEHAGRLHALRADVDVLKERLQP